MEVYRRAHPVTIVFNLGRVFYLIIIPVLRGFVSALRGGFTGWLHGAWADILVFLLMLGIAVINWFAVGFRFDGKRLDMRTGILNRRRVFIAWDNVTTISLIRPFYLRPVRALRFRADTLGGSFRDADFTLLLSKCQARAILRSRRLQSGELIGKLYHPSTGSVAALALLTSNSFGGILYMSAFISQSGKLLGSGFSEMLIDTFQEAARSLAFGIPPAAAALAYILLAGWCIGFLLIFTRYKNFRLIRRKNTLSIKSGVFTNREYYIRYPDINFIDIRQSLVTKLIKLSSLYISAVGYGKHKDDISCIIPAETEARFDASRERIFPAAAPAPRQYKPEMKGLMRFIGLPISFIAGISLLVAVFLWIFPSWDAFISFTGVMAFVPALVFLFIRVIDFKTSGLSFADNNYTLRYSSGLSLHTVIIPKDKVVCVEMRQGFFQKFGPYCDLIISSMSESRSLHRCRSLLKSDLAALFNL